MDKKIYANLALLTVAVIWGLTFTAQRIGMEFVGPFTFNAGRCLLGCISLLPVIILFKLIQKAKKKIYSPQKIFKRRIRLLQGGILCGIILFIAVSLQQYGMIYTTAGKAGFISALYIIFVPLISVFLKQKIKMNIWISVILGFTGLYLLCCRGNLYIAKGEAFVLASAFMFALHILVINYYSPKVNAIKLSCVQFFTAGIMSLIPMFLFEKPQIENIIACRDAFIYSGFFACGVAYTLQIAGQRNTSPVVASLILSLESVFAVIGGYFILQEILTARELLGCGFMITATVLSQLNFKQICLLHPADTYSK